MKDIPGYEGLYAVTEEGKVWSYPKRIGKAHNGKFLKPIDFHHGYKMVKLSDGKNIKSKLIHRLVAKTHIPNPEELPQVNHINGKTGDNRVKNLEWVNNSGNVQNAIMRGTFKRKGSNHPLSKLTDYEVTKIRSLYKTGDFFQWEIAKQFKVTPSLIQQICARKIWVHIT